MMSVSAHPVEDGLSVTDNAQMQHRFDCLLQLAGLSLFLATVEMLIPKPMPFLKLGIANLPILLFVRELRLREMLLLIFLKVFCQNLISGNILSYIAVFSAASSCASGCAMWLLAHVSRRHISFLGISVMGAAASNGMQLLLALNYFFPGTGSLLIPWSLSFGLGSGVLLGLFALQFHHVSLWFKSLLPVFQAPYLALGSAVGPVLGPKDKSCDSESAMQTGTNLKYSQALTHGNGSARLRFGFGLLSMGLMFAIHKLEPMYLGVEFLIFLGLNRSLGYRPWWRSILILLATLIFFNLLLPSGRLLWELHIPPLSVGAFAFPSPAGLHFKLTQGALQRGIGKAFFLLNLIQISRFAVSLELSLPGRLGHIVQLVFYYYEAFLNCPLEFRASRPFASLDAILCQISGELFAATQKSKIQPDIPAPSTPSVPGIPSTPKIRGKQKQNADSGRNKKSRRILAKDLPGHPRYRLLALGLLLQLTVLLLALELPLYRLTGLL